MSRKINSLAVLIEAQGESIRQLIVIGINNNSIPSILVLYYTIYLNNKLPETNIKKISEQLIRKIKILRHRVVIVSVVHLPFLRGRSLYEKTIVGKLG